MVDMSEVLLFIIQKQQGRKKELNELEELRQFNQSHNHQSPSKNTVQNSSDDDETGHRKAPR
jgi:hypothetical protein